MVDLEWRTGSKKLDLRAWSRLGHLGCPGWKWVDSNMEVEGNRFFRAIGRGMKSSLVAKPLSHSWGEQLVKM